MKKSVLAGEKGIAIVEFALVLPLLITLIFGSIEFGLIMYNKQVITNASREGARAGIVKKNPVVDDDTIRERVNYYALDHLVTFGAGGGAPDTAIDRTAGQTSGNDLTVTVNYQYHFLLPFLGDSLQLTAKTVMRYE